MPSERVQRQVDRLLDEAEEAIALRQWEELRATCEVVLNLDPDNSDAAGYLALADKSLDTDVVSGSSDIVERSEDQTLANRDDYASPWGITDNDDIKSELLGDLGNLFKNLIGTGGRINRSGYFVRNTLVWLFFIPGGIVFIYTSEALLSGPAVIGLLLIMAGIVVGWCAAVRRAHDLNYDGLLLSVALMVPLLSFVMSFMLQFRSGTPGINDHGVEPDGLGVGHASPIPKV